MSDKQIRRPDGTYAGAVTHENIMAIFDGAGDFNLRELHVGGHTIYIYAIDGLTSGGDISEYVVKPLMQDSAEGSLQELYDRALHSTVYNSVAEPCRDLNDVADKLVNGFSVVLFGQAGAIAFEDKTGEKRSPSAPEVENTVKGPKDAFTETVRTNTSLLRRHLRTPALRLFETKVGRRSLTNVTVAYIEGLTDPGLVERMKKALGERVADVRVTARLVDSPSCIVGRQDQMMTAQMRRMLEAAGQTVPEEKYALEINPEHPLLVKAAAETDDARFAKWSDFILDQAMLADQGALKDPGAFVKLMNELLLR